MILEGIVTTLDERGTLNIAPMGPTVDAAMQRFVLRPFKSSTTFHNLSTTRTGVFHVVDDALLLARTAIGHDPEIETRAAESFPGRVIVSACRYFEFRVATIDDSADRATIEVETVNSRTLRDFFGWNRAKHAIVELAIVATRAHFLDAAEVIAEFRRLAIPVEKTGGHDERSAYDLLWHHSQKLLAARGFSLDLTR